MLCGAMVLSAVRNSVSGACMSAPDTKQTLQFGMALAATAALAKMPVSSIIWPAWSGSAVRYSMDA